MTGARRAAMLALVLTTASGCARCSARSYAHDLTLATTTSVGNSGLLDAMLPVFERHTQARVHPTLVGSGRALAMLAAGQADVAITHAPESEAAMLRTHPAWRYRKIMYNDFVLVGPKDDSAHIRGQQDVVAAMRRIADAGALFLSRGDQSGTHEREQSLWKLAGRTPSPARLVAAGAGMGATLRVASEMGGYTLTDRATFLQNSRVLQSVILFEGDARLLNTYAVLFDPSGPARNQASAFADWLVGEQGRSVIAGYRINGSVPAFQVWPARLVSSDPHAEPVTAK